MKLLSKQAWIGGLLLSGILGTLVIVCRARTPFSGYYPLLDSDVIQYQTTPPRDPVAGLQGRLDRAETRLAFQQPQGYLLSVLRQLNVPLSSQGLVFSKTSFQLDRIGPATPRALYFNDNVYVGWVQGGKVLEMAAVDPSQGTMFYTLEQRATKRPKFVRREECLQCHASPKTLGVPGLLLRSVVPAADGTPQFQLGAYETNDISPIKERWGGWYVTGTAGGQPHMGNSWLKKGEARFERTGAASGAGVNSLAGFFDVSAYAARDSDVTALLVLAHQTHLHDLIIRVNWETRLAIHARDSGAGASRERIFNAVELLLRGMLFSGEARLDGPIRGTTSFAAEFMARGRRDRRGRSLRDLDLERRLFRYPCSYLIYSEDFAAMPRPALEQFYRRLWEILTGGDTGEAFRGLTRSDRQSILGILRETKADLPDYWRRLRTD